MATRVTDNNLFLWPGRPQADSVLQNTDATWIWQYAANKTGAGPAPQFVSASESARAAKLISPQIQRRRRAEFAVRRQHLSDFLGLSSGELVIATSADGHPRLPDYPEMAISFSHSEHWCAATIGVGPQVGLDIEVIRPIDWQTMLKMISGPDEYTEFLRAVAITPDITLPLFFRVWTLKEAALKYSGAGFQAGAKSVLLPARAFDLDCPVFTLRAFGERLQAWAAIHQDIAAARIIKPPDQPAANTLA